MMCIFMYVLKLFRFVKVTTQELPLFMMEGRVNLILIKLTKIESIMSFINCVVYNENKTTRCDE